MSMATTTPLPDKPLTNPLVAWDWFWFAPRNPTTLGMIRVFSGLIMLYIHFSYSFRLMDFVHPDRAWVDRETITWMRSQSEMGAPSDDWNLPGPQYRLAPGQFIWSVYFHLDADWAIWTVHVLFLVAMFLFTIGLWTRLTGVLTWIGTLQYIHRSPVTLFGMDSMTMLGLFFLMIGGGGAALSVDHWLAQRRERIRRNDPMFVLVPPPSILVNLAIRMMQVQFCFIYLASGTSKLQGAAWWNGNAIWGTLANYEFAPFYIPGYESMLRWLSQHRALWEIAMSGGVIFTLFIEIGFPFLVWVPKMRWFMVSGAVLLHTGIGLLMGLTTFSLMMLVLVASFIPSEVVEGVMKRFVVSRS